MKLFIGAVLIEGILGETISCNGSGVQAIPNRCTEYVHCDQDSGIVRPCAPGTVFHKVSLQKKWSSDY